MPPPTFLEYSSFLKDRIGPIDASLLLDLDNPVNPGRPRMSLLSSSTDTPWLLPMYTQLLEIYSVADLTEPFDRESLQHIPTQYTPTSRKYSIFPEAQCTLSTWHGRPKYNMSAEYGYGKQLVLILSFVLERLIREAGYISSRDPPRKKSKKRKRVDRKLLKKRLARVTEEVWERLTEITKRNKKYWIDNRVWERQNNEWRIDSESDAASYAFDELVYSATTIYDVVGHIETIFPFKQGEIPRHGAVLDYSFVTRMERYWYQMNEYNNYERI